MANQDILHHLIQLQGDTIIFNRCAYHPRIPPQKTKQKKDRLPQPTLSQVPKI